MPPAVEQDLPISLRQLAQEQTVHVSTSLAAGGEAGRHDTRVVHHQHVALPQPIPEPAEYSVRVIGPISGNDQQTRLVSLRQRMLSDQRRRQVVIKIAEFHALCEPFLCNRQIRTFPRRSKTRSS